MTVFTGYRKTRSLTVVQGRSTETLVAARDNGVVRRLRQIGFSGPGTTKRWNRPGRGGSHYVAPVLSHEILIYMPGTTKRWNRPGRGGSHYVAPVLSHEILIYISSVVRSSYLR